MAASKPPHDPMRHGGLDESPLAQALGNRFRVSLGYRARKMQIVCKLCAECWWIPRSEKDSLTFAFLKQHECKN